MPEVAEILRRYGDEYLKRFDRVLPSHRRAIRDIVTCRTAALGGEVWRCPGCDELVYRYHSCRNRACPKCHRAQTESWLQARSGELVEAPYFHVVFTVPEELRRVIRSHQRVLYDVLTKAAAQALQELAGDRRYCGGEIAALAVLHTATRALEYHPHVHVLVPGVGLGPSGELCRARQGFFVPVRALSKLFAGKLLSMARKALASDVVLPRVRHKWVVYCKPAVQGADRVLEYLGRYVFRHPLSNRHIVGVDEGVVSFRYRANHDHEWRTMGLAVDEFLRRFLQHVLPQGLHKIRYLVCGTRRDAQTSVACSSSRTLRLTTTSDRRQVGESNGPPPQSRAHIAAAITWSESAGCSASTETILSPTEPHRPPWVRLHDASALSSADCARHRHKQIPPHRARARRLATLHPAPSSQRAPQQGRLHAPYPACVGQVACPESKIQRVTTSPRKVSFNTVLQRLRAAEPFGR
jgi:hypothetical protein